MYCEFKLKSKGRPAWEQSYYCGGWESFESESRQRLVFCLIPGPLWDQTGFLNSSHKSNNN